MDFQIVPIQQQAAHRLAQPRAAGIAAGNHIMAVLVEPFSKQPHLRRFARAVAAVDGEKHWKRGLGGGGGQGPDE